MFRIVSVFLLAALPVSAQARTEEECRAFGNDIYDMMERRSEKVAQGKSPGGPMAERANMTSPLFTADTIESDMLFNDIFAGVVGVEHDLAKMSLYDRASNIAFATRRFRAKCIDDTL